ncbi:DUF2147 domain-containing protein [Cochleicola gelatinilyticus]|uniref:DUF2147 domain-containing protein n=1 Tax=Cochleicola gelatinilyticus TaxID=1763537 RepID=A0A167HRP1_9FLAO|nr:DUF2147 domain-containing protein [Cochleicola gelatinilyticus]OAB78894.1 hypothetical protein ULVI_09960 [Cochleicola gelatinilyticus]
MKKIALLLIICVSSTTLFAQGVMGDWKTIDDNTGEAKSIVTIYERDGKVYGKVKEIFNEERRDVVCVECTGKDKNKPVLGLEIIKDLEKDGDEYTDGTITDPENGKQYKCYITLEEPNKLKVRGYVGFSLLGRTQYWVRQQ